MTYSGEHPPTRLFGVPTVLKYVDAAVLASDLRKLFVAQCRGVPARSSTPTVDDSPLATDLALLRYWFDPVAKGERLREALSSLPGDQFVTPHATDMLVAEIPPPPGEPSQAGRRLLVSPEGILVLHCVEDALEVARSVSELPASIRLDESVVARALETLALVYRQWCRQRLDQVVALLTSEPSTLRPAAAGLLLVLLINRNTAPDRALPRPRDRRKLDLISQAIGGPAHAYAHVLSGSISTAATGFDLYRGWALGELRRRLGTALHTDLDEGIYLDPAAEELALGRLADDISRRRPAARARAEEAVEAALVEYSRARPLLAGLGLAFDTPSHTQRIRRVLFAAAAGTERDSAP